MPSNERPLQKPATRGTRKSANPLSINTTQEQSIRDTQYDDEYLLGEDDPYASNPPRPPSSAIRLNSPTTRRSTRDVNTDTQTRRSSQNNVPPRRTQQKQDFGQPTGVVAAPTRSTRATTTAYEVLPTTRRKRKIHWLLYVGLGMLAALALWALASAALSWGTNQYNNFVYGYPRTFQTDAVVGHNDSAHNPSHFIAVNLRGQVIIFELPGGDPSKSTDYIGPDLVGAQIDQLPVTLSFSDINHDGAVDMIVHVSDKDFPFCNNLSKKIFQACGNSTG